MPLPPLGPLCIDGPLFICTMVISRGYKNLEVNWVINVAETEVFHNKFTKKIKKIVILFSTLTSSRLYDHTLEKRRKMGQCGIPIQSSSVRCANSP